MAQPIPRISTLEGAPSKLRVGGDFLWVERTLTVRRIPALFVPRGPLAAHSDSISNLLGRMRNSQRLAPILRGDVSGVEPAKARDQRSHDRGDRRPLSPLARLLSSAAAAQYAQPKRSRARHHASHAPHSATS